MHSVKIPKTATVTADGASIFTVLGREIPGLTKFAVPIVFAQAGFMFMGVVDTAMVGRLGAAELAGTGVARSIFWLVAVFASGMLSSIDIFASHALGAQRNDELARIFTNGFKLAIWLCLIFTPFLYVVMHGLTLLNYEPHILLHAQTYLLPIAFGLPCMVLFSFMQRYWQSQKLTRPILRIVIGANIFNYFANDALIFGNYGLPNLGVFGAGLATTLSRTFMCVAILWLTIRKLKQSRVPISFHPKALLSLDVPLIKKMVRYGLPAGAQLAFEVGLFSLIMIFAAKLTPEEAAAHQIVLIICSFTYMFPLGLGNAAAFRVGHFVGQGDFRMAKLSGFVAIGLGALLMSIMAFTLFSFPHEVLSIFTKDPRVINVAINIFSFAALFQIVDALQSCSIGSLRGAGNTSYASIVSAIGFYPVGLLLGFVLCFHFEMRLVGLWIGLTVGLLVIAIAVLYYWINITPVATFSEKKIAS